MTEKKTIHFDSDQISMVSILCSRLHLFGIYKFVFLCSKPLFYSSNVVTMSEDSMTYHWMIFPKWKRISHALWFRKDDVVYMMSPWRLMFLNDLLTPWSLMTELNDPTKNIYPTCCIRKIFGSKIFHKTHSSQDICSKQKCNYYWLNQAIYPDSYKKIGASKYT